MVTKNKTGQVVLNIIFILLTIAALAPFLLLISSSFSSEAALGGILNAELLKAKGFFDNL